MVLAAWVLHVCACGPSPVSKTVPADLSEERRLITIPTGSQVWKHQESPDGRIYAIVLTGGELLEVVWSTGARQKVDHQCELASSAGGGWIASASWDGKRSTIQVNGKTVLERDVHVPHLAVDDQG
jgi:hypothetical protein